MFGALVYGYLNVALLGKSFIRLMVSFIIYVLFYRNKNSSTIDISWLLNTHQFNLGGEVFRVFFMTSYIINYGLIVFFRGEINDT